MRTAIIGAGPSGLALNLFLNEPAELWEASGEVGGHASTFETGGFTFDYGPHIMFSRDKEVLDFMVASLGDNVHRCTRNNKISIKNRLLRYPFENDLAALPPEDNFDCLYHFLFNPYAEQYREPTDLRQWLLKTFGEGICRHYLFPYNEKVWNLPVDQLSMLWADRIPNPPVVDVIKSAIGVKTEGYLHQLFYHYPLRGGYQAISQAWAKPAQIKFDARVSHIRRDGNGFLLSDGKGETRYERIVTTMPIQHLLEVVDWKIPEAIAEAVSRLVVNPMYVVSLGVRGEDPNQYTAIYFPEREFLVNRVSYPCTFSPRNGPAGHHSIQAEITCRPDSPEWRMSDAEIKQHVIEGLIQRGLLSSAEAVVVADVRRRDFSYVVYDRDYEKNVAQVRKYFAEQNVHLLGRFSFFEYINVDQAVVRALEVAAEMNGEKLAEVRSQYLKRALKKQA